MDGSLQGQVECYSGSAYAERPVAIHWEGERLEVMEILKEWRSPSGKAFQVLTARDLKFELYYEEAEDIWHIRLVSA